MSGPGMIGVFAGCKLDFRNGVCDEAHVGPWMIGDFYGQDTRWWVSNQIGYYLSVGNRPNSRVTNMVVLESQVERVSIGNPRTRMLYHGLPGASFMQMFGPGVKPVSRVAIKMKPVAFRTTLPNGWILEGHWNVRYLPVGVDNDDLLGMSGLFGARRRMGP